MVAVQDPPRKAEWVKVRKSWIFHLFYEGDSRSRCGMISRVGVPANETFYLPPSAPISATCKRCRQLRKER